jgi:D-arabinose 5-phosphate isomerase GutQ
MLVRLTYASRASHSVSAELIREILDSSQRNNPAKGLTGILCCNADIFFAGAGGSACRGECLVQPPGG